jgi:RNA polymerase sigma-70 factor (ECF subfamily)
MECFDGARVDAIQTAPESEAGVIVPVDAWAGAYGAELERHVTRMLGSVDEARDVVQELWVTALRTSPDSGDGSNIRAWLYRVATRRALDVIAARRRRGTLLEARGAELEPDRPDRPDAWMSGLSTTGAQAVRERVAALPCRQRDAVWLRWIEGKDYPAIAARLGSTEEAARANVYQGMKKLRHQLAGVWSEEVL